MEHDWMIPQAKTLDELLVEIKECPFCGKTGQLSSLFNDKGFSEGYYVCCTNPACSARMIPEITANLAIIKWNNRK